MTIISEWIFKDFIKWYFVFSYDDKLIIIISISQLDNLTEKNIGLFTNRFFKRNLSDYIEYLN